MQQYFLDKKIIGQRFNKASAHYDRAAFIQKEIGIRLEERLEDIKLSPYIILDVGCGTGAQLSLLAKRYPKASIIAVDLAESMLNHAKTAHGELKNEYVAADVFKLPFPDDSVDLIFSNLMFQWCEPLDSALAECARVLREGGLLLFATLGPDTLQELRYCWSKIDQQPHVNAFLDMHHIGDMLLKLKLADPVMDMEYVTASYKNVMDMMHDLQQVGASNSLTGRRKGLTGKTQFKQLAELYEEFKMDDQRLPMTYEVIYGHAWKFKKSTPTETYIRVEDIKKTK